MTKSTTIIGIDPGLVHSGVVRIRIYDDQVWDVNYEIVNGDDITRIASAVEQFDDNHDAHIFIEKYRDRGTVFTTHSRMREMEVALKKALRGALLIDNTGVKQIVTKELMVLLNVWTFPTTNHQDLQAAARIALYGALKNEDLNKKISSLVTNLLGIKNRGYTPEKGRGK